MSTQKSNNPIEETSSKSQHTMQTGRTSCATPNESAKPSVDPVAANRAPGEGIKVLGDNLIQIKGVIGVTVLVAGSSDSYVLYAKGGEAIECFAAAMCKAISALRYAGQPIDPARGSFGRFGVTVQYWGSCTVAITYALSTSHVKSLRRGIQRVQNKYDQGKLKSL